MREARMTHLRIIILALVFVLFLFNNRNGSINAQGNECSQFSNRNECNNTPGCEYYPFLNADVKCRIKCSFSGRRQCKRAPNCLFINKKCVIGSKVTEAPTFSTTEFPTASPGTRGPTKSPTTRSPTKEPTTQSPILTRSPTQQPQTSSPTKKPFVFEAPPLGASTLVIAISIPFQSDTNKASTIWIDIQNAIKTLLRLGPQEIVTLRFCQSLPGNRADLPLLSVGYHPYCFSSQGILNGDRWDNSEVKSRVSLRVSLPRTRLSSVLLNALIAEINLVLTTTTSDGFVLDIRDDSIAPIDVSSIPPNGKDTRPNVIMILADDLGYGDVGYQSCKTLGVTEKSGMPCSSHEITPNIDALSKHQHTAVFSRFYAHVQCSPSRLTILTGVETARTCSLSNVFDPNSNEIVSLSPKTPSIGLTMRAAGYRTFMGGKWHVSSPIPCGKACPFSTPYQNGFDRYIVTPRSAATYNSNCGCSKSFTCDVGIYNTSWFFPQYARTGEGVFHKYLQSRSTFACDPIVVDVEGTGQESYKFPVKEGSNLYFDSFKSFVDTYETSKPFFAALWFHNPHAPYVSDEVHRAKARQIIQRQNPSFCGGLFDFSVPEQGGPGHCSKSYTASACKQQCKDIKTEYYASIIAMDETIGLLFQYLKDKSIDDNTILIFNSDNGPARYDTSAFGVRYVGPGSTSGIGGVKLDLLEGGIRVPGFMYHPKLIQQNIRVNNPVGIIDIFPTIVEMTHGPKDAETAIAEILPLDGISFIPFIRGLTEIQRFRGMGYTADNGRRMYIFEKKTLMQNLGSNRVDIILSDGKSLEDYTNSDLNVGENSNDKHVRSLATWRRTIGAKCTYGK